MALWLQPTSVTWIEEQLTILAHVYWADSDPTGWAARFKVYPELLKQYPQDLLEKAIRAGMATWKWFPKPAEIIEQIDEEHRRRRGEARRLRQLAQESNRAHSVAQDTPEQQAAVARGLANLGHWRGMITSKYTGPWPTPAEFQDDARYQAFVRNMHEMGEAA